MKNLLFGTAVLAVLIVVSDVAFLHGLTHAVVGAIVNILTVAAHAIGL